MLKKLEGIYAITPVVDSMWNMDSVLDCSEAVLSAGVEWIQLRQKNLSPHESMEMAHSLGLLCQKYQANLILNDAPSALNWLDVPALSGVHLGKEDWPVRDARAGRAQGQHPRGAVLHDAPPRLDHRIAAMEGLRQKAPLTPRLHCDGELKRARARVSGTDQRFRGRQRSPG